MSKFKFTKTGPTLYNNPQEMYDDYKNRQIDGIHDYQSKIIDQYMEPSNFKAGSITIELPTGTGKTLIGLLIAEFRRTRYNEKVLFLCPTNQLVNQVVRQSNEEYGIKCVSFTGSQRDYDPLTVTEFNAGKIIGVTNYSTLFNSNPYFKDADILIFDDAHLGDNYVASNWTVTIGKYKDIDLYAGLINLMSDDIDENFYSILTKESPSPAEINDCDMIPVFNTYERSTEIITLVDKYLETSGSSIRFSWRNIRNNLQSCLIYLNWNRLVIRPYIPPTKTLDAFSTPKQRIFMSATFGKCGELERTFGIDKIKRLDMVKDWENKAIGRRFFLFPSTSYSESESKEFIKQLLTLVERSLVIVKSDKAKAVFEDWVGEQFDHTIEIFDIRENTDDYIKSSNGISVVANRFSGMDLPNDECRLLILNDLPDATHLQEKFLISRMASRVLYQERIKSRIIQAVGRCTRGNTDYAVVCVLGNELGNALYGTKNIADYNPEIRAEISFGYDNSKEKGTAKYLELVDLFLNKKDEWQEADDYIIALRNDFIEEDKGRTINYYNYLLNSAKYEVKVQYCLWKNDFKQAF